MLRRIPIPATAPPRMSVAPLRVMGIDPGTLRVGYAVLAGGGSPRALAWGVIRPPAGDAIARRLAFIHAALSELLKRWAPDAVAIESAFYGKSIPAALRIGEGRGAAMAAAAGLGIAVASYSPAEVKKAVVGNGAAHKRQVQTMARSLLALKEPMPYDASDALAVAICHLHRG